MSRRGRTVTVERVLLIVAVAGLVLVLIWLVALTIEQRRTRAHLGEPVYRRLPDGRLAFTWSAHNDYHATRIQAGTRGASDVRDPRR